MKRIISTLFFAIILQLGYAQTTYYWVGGTSPTSFTANSNWNTSLDGLGTVRAAQANNDVLIFDGTNVGGSTPTTGTVVAPVTSTAMGRLILQNGADVALTRSSSGTATITIGDDPNGNDLVVFSGCKFRLRGLIGSVLILLANNAVGTTPATTSATAMIYGDVLLEEATPTSSTVAQNRFTSRLKGAFVFTGGSSLTTFANYGYYPFGTTGSSTTPVAGGVVFEDGSSFYYGGGASPFGSNSVSFLVDFKPGSKFYFRAAPATNMFNARVYGDVVIDNNTTVTADGTLVRIDSLRVESGSTFITHTTGSTPINGNIINNGIIRVPSADPDRNNRIVLVNSAPQSIGGTGTYTFADFIISNVSNVTLQKSIQVDSIINVFGKLNPNGNATTGPAVITIKSTQTLTTSGSVNVDSFIVKNITDFTNIEPGMSVSGTNIQPNTVITNTSTTAGTITLSKPATGSTYTSSQSLTIFNGNGQVFPIKFGDISASLQNGQTKITWNILTESNIARYVVERSADAFIYKEVSAVAASGKSVYNAIDATPLAGVNYYRIKSVSNDGEVKYSIVLKVNNSKGKASVLVYPNPVRNKIVSVQLNNLQKGSYTMSVINNLGQVLLKKVIAFDGGTNTQTLQLPTGIKAGAYTFSLVGDEVTFQQTLLVQ